jgi:ubiquitin-protein ligase
MSVTPSQLSEINKELIKSFIADPIISITSTKGDPPDQYDISYQIGGLSLSDTGEVRESFGHTISLTIPFGFPHFPPSCKPKSNIFHPDFDPAAICIGNFWEENESLPDLIVTIGRMINGEIFSTSNVFNEEAGYWYSKHPEKFPLSDIKWGIIHDSNADEDQTVDTLDDDDLSTDFNFYEMDIDNDEEISISDSFPEVEAEPSPEIESSELLLLQKQKRYFKILHTLKGSTRSSDELLRLSEESSKQIKIAQKFFAQAKKYEKQGDARKSLELFEKTAATVTDYPDIDADIKRLKQALTFLDDLPSDIDAPVSRNAKEPQITESEASSLQTFPGEKKSPRRLHFEERQHPKLQLLAVGVILLVVAGGSGYFWYSTTQKLSAALQASNVCKNLLQEDKFTESRNACEQGLELLKKVKFIKRAEVSSITDSLSATLQSEKLIQGLAGNILLDGKYVSKAEAERRMIFNTTLHTANEAYEKKQWQNAIDSYTKVGELFIAGEQSGPISKEEIDQRIAFSRFSISFAKAEKLVEMKKWNDAMAQLEATKPLLTGLSPESLARHGVLLQTMYNKSRFNSFKQKGDQAFADSRWQEASEYYSDAMNSFNQKDQILPEAADLIKSNNQRAQLYKTITEGNQAFASAEWDLAIKAYGQADSFLMDNPELLSKSDHDESRRKLARIRLHTSIIRDQQRAEQEIADKMLEQAKATYTAIIRNIESSRLGGDDQFARNREEFSKKIEELDSKIEQEELISYLTDNFKSLFVANYPASNKENLTKPLINFTKMAGSKLVFRMQCSETGRGRPLILVMSYAYDRDKKTWSLYSDG